MVKRLVQVIDPVGLHARPATVLVMTATKFTNNTIKLITEEGKEIEAKSVLMVMGSAIKANVPFTLQFEGENADQNIEEMISVLAKQKIIEKL